MKTISPRLARILTRLYPRAWRSRYADEFAALLESQSATPRNILNTLFAASRERITPTQPQPVPAGLRATLADATGYWERGRILYNLALTAVAAIWVVTTWPHFRPTPISALLPLSGLALIANLCYSAAYLADIPLRRSAIGAAWAHRRWILWLLGTLFAILLENYWIADEIYPFVR